LEIYKLSIIVFAVKKSTFYDPHFGCRFSFRYFSGHALLVFPSLVLLLNPRLSFLPYV
jgi:hypothetical protein